MNKEITQPQLGAAPIEVDNMGVDVNAIIDEYKLSSSYVQMYTRDFISLDNLVDGVPTTKSDDAPFVADTTLPGLVRSIPRNSLEQLPVFSAIVNGSKNNIAALVCTYLLKKRVFNEDTFGKGLLSTLQLGAEQALTHGYAPFMVGTGSMYNDFGTRMRLLHFVDTSPEPGITDHNETGYDYVVANLAPSRVKRIIKAAKANPKTSWNVPALELLLEAGPRAKDYSIYESAVKRNQPGEAAGPTFQIVTRYETGPGGSIVTFSPDMHEGPLRVIKSKSKWGYPRVQYLVIDPAALTPFGTSRVRLASPNQNLMNVYLGNIASMLLINSDPPILKRGRFIKPVQLKRKAVWETLDPNASADLKQLDNGALAQFAPFSQQFASQIKNIMGNPLGDAGTEGVGNTGPGVKLKQNQMDASTNQITKILENFLRQYAIVGLDTLLSESEGEDDIILDDDTKNAINRIAQNEFVPQVDPTTGQPSQFQPPVGSDNKLHINSWEDFYAAIEDWSIDIEVSVSKDELEEKKRADMQDMLTVLVQNSDALGPDGQNRITQLIDALMEDTTPTIKPLDADGAQDAQAAAPQPGTTQTPTGQVHETGDLVKLFSTITDPNVKNAILSLLGLPPERSIPQVTGKPLLPVASGAAAQPAAEPQPAMQQ